MIIVYMLSYTGSEEPGYPYVSRLSYCRHADVGVYYVLVAQCWYYNLNASCRLVGQLTEHSRQLWPSL